MCCCCSAGLVEEYLLSMATMQVYLGEEQNFLSLLSRFSNSFATNFLVSLPVSSPSDTWDCRGRERLSSHCHTLNHFSHSWCLINSSADRCWQCVGMHWWFTLHKLPNLGCWQGSSGSPVTLKHLTINHLSHNYSCQVLNAMFHGGPFDWVAFNIILRTIPDS